MTDNITRSQNVKIVSQIYLDANILQESCAIAKMTAQCALYMGALKISKFRDSLTTPTATIPNIISRAFVRIDPMNVPTKYEVHSFIRS